MISNRPGQEKAAHHAAQARKCRWLADLLLTRENASEAAGRTPLRRRQAVHQRRSQSARRQPGIHALQKGIPYQYWGKGTGGRYPTPRLVHRL